MEPLYCGHLGAPYMRHAMARPARVQQGCRLQVFTHSQGWDMSTCMWYTVSVSDRLSYSTYSHAPSNTELKRKKQDTTSSQQLKTRAGARDQRETTAATHPQEPHCLIQSAAVLNHLLHVRGAMLCATGEGEKHSWTLSTLYRQLLLF